MAKNENKPQVAELIRILGTDIKSGLNLVYGLSKIKGVSYMFANAMCVSLKLDKNKKIGELSEKEIQDLETFFQNPEKKGIPEWMMNKQRDIVTGNTLHYNGKDLEFNELQLRRRLYKTKSYKAIRTRAKLPLRGQRTKSNFRRSKMFAAMKAKSGGGKK